MKTAAAPKPHLDPSHPEVMLAKGPNQSLGVCGFNFSDMRISVLWSSGALVGGDIGIGTVRFLLVFATLLLNILPSEFLENEKRKDSDEL